MFRTPTGQTGTDAYIYEAAQIANGLRELNARAARLARIMADELPIDSPFTMDISSEPHPTATHQGQATERFLLMLGNADSAEYLARVARGIADPTYIVRH